MICTTGARASRPQKAAETAALPGRPRSGYEIAASGHRRGDDDRAGGGDDAVVDPQRLRDGPIRADHATSRREPLRRPQPRGDRRQQHGFRAALRRGRAAGNGGGSEPGRGDFQSPNDAAEAASYEESLEIRLDRRMRSEALDWARSHPGEALRLAAVKFARIWNVWPNEAQFSAPLIRLGVFVTYVPLLALGIYGAARTFRRGWPYILCWLPGGLHHRAARRIRQFHPLPRAGDARPDRASCRRGERKDEG